MTFFKTVPNDVLSQIVSPEVMITEWSLTLMFLPNSSP